MREFFTDVFLNELLIQKFGSRSPSSSRIRRIPRGRLITKNDFTVIISDYHPARDVYREATDTLRQAGAEKLERLLVLEQWLAFEKAENDEANLNYVKVR